MCSGKDQVASASDRSKSQEQVETIKTLSLARHNQYSSIPDELLLLQARAMDTSDKRLRMTNNHDGCPSNPYSQVPATNSIFSPRERTTGINRSFISLGHHDHRHP